VNCLPSVYRHPSADLYPYVEGKRGPLYPFGFGLSYTRSICPNPGYYRPTGSVPDGKVQVEVEVTNSGNRDGDEVVQIYVRDERSSAPRPEGIESLSPGDA
jgi:beta-glucosidase